jgi:NADH-ubiquinone oxidoreductase chain 1
VQGFLYPLIDILAVVLPILLVVAYVTLLERKVLGSMQRRVGPDTVGVYGIAQPFADALKLLVKEMVLPQQSQRVIFILAPAVTLICALLALGVIPFGPGLMIADLELGWLFALAVSSVAVYGILFAGWSSNSTYSLIGGLRSCAVLVSYELALSGAALGAVFLVGSFSLTNITEYQESIWLAIPLIPLLLIFLITCLSELSRTPFDLQEAESELVAGFFTEYSAFIFVAFFLSEYCSMVVLSTLTAILFFGGSNSIFGIDWLTLSGSSISLGLKTCFLLFCIIWVRATLPRMRYDQLQVFCWTVLLPLIFGLLVLFISLFIGLEL